MSEYDRCFHFSTNASVSFDRQVPRKPRLVGGGKGHNINEISFPGSPALWAGSFTELFSQVEYSLMIFRPQSLKTRLLSQGLLFWG